MGWRATKMSFMGHTPISKAQNACGPPCYFIRRTAIRLAVGGMLLPCRRYGQAGGPRYVCGVLHCRLHPCKLHGAASVHRETPLNCEPRPKHSRNPKLVHSELELLDADLDARRMNEQIRRIEERVWEKADPRSSRRSGSMSAPHKTGIMPRWVSRRNSRASPVEALAQE